MLAHHIRMWITSQGGGANEHPDPLLRGVKLPPPGLQFAGHSGIFEVSINDDVVYTNETTYRFPTDEEIFAKIDEAKK
jgi:Rdx family